MGVIAKTKQYGTMRAIGMSNQQLIKMIVAEAMTYAVSGIILGCIIGLPMHWVVFESLITNFWGTAWSIPIFPLALMQKRSTVYGSSGSAFTTTAWAPSRFQAHFLYRHPMYR